MSGGRLKIDLLPAGAVVGAFQVLDAVNDGLLDAAHTVPVYWYGKHKAASLFCTGPVFGGSATTMMAWFYQGGGSDLYKELTQDILGLDVYGFRSEEHTSELQSLMRISYAVFCLKKKTIIIIEASVHNTTITN